MTFSDNRQPSTAILLNNDGMGQADISLQHKLIRTYLTLLLENGALPGAICFYTAGVKLVCEGSPVLEQLAKLEERGVHLIVCLTCLKHYDLESQVKVGVVGGMADIIAAQWQADKVVTL
jgi:intracellular sulfur oxidation DsrE/DsrF family protein